MRTRPGAELKSSRFERLKQMGLLGQRLARPLKGLVASRL